MSLDVSIGWCALRLSVSFVFFKQKTAYEMRISDWSSDVCSSDLLTLAVLDMYPRQRGSASSLQAFTGLVMNAHLAGVLSPLLSHRGIHLALASRSEERRCRERVCQTV